MSLLNETFDTGRNSKAFLLVLTKNQGAREGEFHMKISVIQR